MVRLHAFVLSFLLFSALCSSALGQNEGAVKPGDEVRFATAGESVSGRVTSINDSSMSVRVRKQFTYGTATKYVSGVATLPLYHVTELQVGEKRSRWRKALIGSGIGLATGLATTGVLLARCDDDCWGGLVVYSGLVFFTAPLTAVGGAIGALLPPGYRWRDARVKPQLGMTYHPETGAGLALRLRW